jgi:hypothetical protein
MKPILTKIALILVFFMALSCGARKAEKTRTSEASKTETSNTSNIEKKEEATVKVIEKTTVDDKTKTRTKETSYKPIDPTKEASVTTPDGKKHNLNNAEIIIKETEQENNTKTDNSRNSSEFHKLELSEVSESGTKTAIKKDTEEIKVERSAWSGLNLLWGLIPLGLVLAWLNKSKIITWARNIWWV